MASPHGSSRPANRLAKEESPYLKQHALNPVDWYPWGEEAFARARQENKPIFLSIGYSTCHWCHVMERESFESDEVAKLLNENFVAVKVDREERPDVDKTGLIANHSNVLQVYMTYVQATQGGGGWPMSVWLTPDLHPFLGGTYFPPEDKFGRRGFKSVLKTVASVWRDKEADIRDSAADTVRQLKEMTASDPAASSAGASAALGAAPLMKCAEMLVKRYDEKLGGFGAAPKFPRPSEINALLRLWSLPAAAVASSRVPRETALAISVHSLKAMWSGGVYDHVGGGFARYSVDEYWHVPHFEKMLYDNGQLASTYLDAYLGTGDVAFADAARGVLDYLRRDMTAPQGGIYSAEDADSVNEHGESTEGAFYLWKQDEIEKVLGAERAKVFCDHYFVKAEGNAILSKMSDPHGEFVGKNILREARPLPQTAQRHGLSEEAAAALLAECRAVLHAVRAKRPRPHLDDKILVSWNGLAISAFAKASRVLAGQPKPGGIRFPVDHAEPSAYLEAAVKAATFIRETLYDPKTKVLRRSFCKNPSAALGFADDYCFLIAGLLDLYEASADTAWLDWALELQRELDTHFWDGGEGGEGGAGGYFNTRDGDPAILLRMKEDYDSAEPAASSVAVENLLRLSGLLGEDPDGPLRARALACAAAFSARLRDIPLAMPALCAALAAADPAVSTQIVVAAASSSSGGVGGVPEEFLDAALGAALLPARHVVAVDLSGGSASRAFWAKNNPQALEMAETELKRLASGKEAGAAGSGEGSGAPPAAAAVAMVCRDFVCQRAAKSAGELRAQLQKAAAEQAGAGGGGVKQLTAQKVPFA